jgi:hypothetical protein
MLARIGRRYFRHLTKQPEEETGGVLWKWLKGLLGADETDKDQKSSDTDDEDGEGGLMMPVPQGVDRL